MQNAESSKGRIDQHKFVADWKNLLRCCVEESLKGQLIIRNRSFAIFSATEKALTGRKKRSRGPYVVQVWSVGFRFNYTNNIFTKNATSASDITWQDIQELLYAREIKTKNAQVYP